jgi:hypothetical protein
MTRAFQALPNAEKPLQTSIFFIQVIDFIDYFMLPLFCAAR